jgi:hypothetical protein
MHREIREAMTSLRPHRRWRSVWEVAAANFNAKLSGTRETLRNGASPNRNVAAAEIARVNSNTSRSGSMRIPIPDHAVRASVANPANSQPSAEPAVTRTRLFEEQLNQQGAPAGSERLAQAELALPVGIPRNQEQGYIGAGDHQNQSDHEHEEGKRMLVFLAQILDTPHAGKGELGLWRRGLGVKRWLAHYEMAP